MNITFITNTGCGYCAAAMKIASTPEFKTWMADSGAVLTDTQYNAKGELIGGAQYSSAAGKAALKLFKISGSLKVPLVLLTDDSGNKIAWFSYRPAIRSRTAANLIAAIEAKCGGACSPSAPTVAQKVCKTCGQVIPMVLLACGIFLAGCENLSGKYEVKDAAIIKDGVTVVPEKTTTVKIVRNAFFWPSKLGMGEIVFPAATNTTPGKVSLSGYESTGGAAELVPLVDANGKVIGSILGTAAKTAVVP